MLDLFWNTVYTFENNPPQPLLCLDNSRIWKIRVHSSRFHASSITVERCWPRHFCASSRDTGLNSTLKALKYETPHCVQNNSVLCVFFLQATFVLSIFTVYWILSHHSCDWHWNVLVGIVHSRGIFRQNIIQMRCSFVLELLIHLSFTKWQNRSTDFCLWHVIKYPVSTRAVYHRRGTKDGFKWLQMRWNR